jgi:hypothetical protein
LQSLSFEIFYLSETDSLRSILDIFRKNIQILSGKLSGKTEKHNIGIHWYASSSKAWSSRISTCYPDGLRLILDFFSKKNPEFFRKTLKWISKNSKFEYPFLISQLATHDDADFQLFTCYPDRLRQIFDLFSRKFQSFSGKLLSEIQKIPNLNIHLYLSISNACSCWITALYLLPRPA